MKQLVLEAAYEGVDEDLATLSEQASKAPAAKPVQEIPKEIVQGYPVPKPRPKPIEVLMMAAANMTDSAGFGATSDPIGQGQAFRCR